MDSIKCRICLVEDVRMSIINTNLQQLYEKLTVMPFQRDGRPLHVCYMCSARLRNSYSLQVNCLKSEQHFSEMLLNNEVKLTSFQYDTLQIVHPLINFSFRSIDEQADIKVDNEPNVDPLELIGHIHVKEERTEALEGNNIDQEVNTSYKELEDIIKTEKDYTVDGYEFCNNQNNNIVENDNLLFESAEMITDFNDKQEYNIPSPELTDNICLKNVKIELNRIDLDCINTSASAAKKAELKTRKPIEVHTNKKTYKCEIRFSLKRNLKRHTGEKVFQCSICKKYFRKKCDLTEHVRIHSGEKPFKCDICEKCFSHHSNLRIHKRVHTGEKPFKCDLCEKCFSHQSNLKTHISLHTGEKPFKCDICKKSFISQSNLITHLRVHTGEKPFKCDFCEKCFGHQSNLRTHLSVHTGEKPFKCDLCEKCFSKPSHLTDHMRIHTGEKPFKCDVCQKCFSKRNTLTRHILIHTGEKPFKCEVCEKFYRYESHLKAHIRIHTNEKPFKCDVCEKVYTYRRSLLAHKCLHTGKRPINCITKLL